MLTHKSAAVTDPQCIANIFNDYFSSIAEKTKANIKFSNKSFQYFLHHTNEKSLFITSADAHKVNLIISSLNSNKSTGPHSLPTEILKLLKMRFLLILQTCLIYHFYRRYSNLY